MTDNKSSIESISDIRRMMERSSRFISLSGWSGISAGICALIGGWVAHPYIYGQKEIHFRDVHEYRNLWQMLSNSRLWWIALLTLISALVLAVLFTWLRSKREGFSMMNSTSKRLMINAAVPMVAGGLFLLKLVEQGAFELIAPGCLIFYGLGLVNASKYTLEELRYLGYCEILLGLLSMFFFGYGLYFWMAGFGLLHIAYGTYMWLKYERGKKID